MIGCLRRRSNLPAILCFSSLYKMYDGQTVLLLIAILYGPRVEASDIRLVNGSSPHSGRVEVYLSGQWCTVCDDGWDLDAAQVACRWLGYPGALAAASGAFYGEGEGTTFLYDVSCSGEETDLFSCQDIRTGEFSCSHTEDAGVMCQGNLTDMMARPSEFTIKAKEYNASCPYEVLTTQGMNLTFPQTRIGTTSDSIEQCILNTTEGYLKSTGWILTEADSDGQPLASCLCGSDLSNMATWEEPVLYDCVIPPATTIHDVLEDLAKMNITEENVGAVSEALETLTQNISSIDEGEVSTVVDILDDVVGVGDPSPEVTSDVVNVVNNLIQGDETEITNASSTSRVVLALEMQVSTVLDSGGNFSEVTPSLAVEALNIPESSLVYGVGFVAKENSGSDSLTEAGVSVYFPNPGDSVPVAADRVETSINIPGAVLNLLGSPTVPISFVLYQNSQLFNSRLIDDTTASPESSSYIASSVISANVESGQLKDLPADTPIVSTFLENQEMNNTKVHGDQTGISISTLCVFWDFSLENGVGDWSPEGCWQAESVKGRIVCHCNHATSFAVLVNIHYHTQESFTLDVISKVGCAISIVSLLITITAYLAIRSMRRKLASHILLSFATSLLCLYLVFVAGIDQTSCYMGCLSVAVLLHYFTLTSVMWMGVEAVNLYLKLVKVFDNHVRYFFVKVSIISWGFPIVVVAVVLAVDHSQYGDGNSCFLKPGPAFYYGQLLIIGLVLLFNFVIFQQLLRKLICKTNTISKSVPRRRQNKASKRLQNVMTITVLLGLTWTFGVLSVIEASNFAFQVLFCVFNSLQGLFIFVLFVVRHDKIRGTLISRITGRKGATTDSSISNGYLKTTTTSDVSSVHPKLEMISGIHNPAVIGFDMHAFSDVSWKEALEEQQRAGEASEDAAEKQDVTEEDYRQYDVMEQDEKVGGDTAHEARAQAKKQDTTQGLNAGGRTVGSQEKEVMDQEAIKKGGAIVERATE